MIGTDQLKIQLLVSIDDCRGTETLFAITAHSFAVNFFQAANSSHSLFHRMTEKPIYPVAYHFGDTTTAEADDRFEGRARRDTKP